MNGVQFVIAQDGTAVNVSHIVTINIDEDTDFLIYCILSTNNHKTLMYVGELGTKALTILLEAIANGQRLIYMSEIVSQVLGGGDE